MTLSLEQRNELLDELKNSFDNFLGAERTRVTRQVTLLESLAEGRGLGGIADNALNSLGPHAQDDLDIFTSGG